MTELPTLRDLWRCALSLDGAIPADAQDVLTALEVHANPPLAAQLTALQRQALAAFSEDADARHLVLSAPTSSGKTTIAQMLLVRAVVLAPERRCAVYVAPTRALAHAFYDDLRAQLADTPLAEDIIVSTSDAPDDDWRLVNGDYAIASLVYEKAHLVFAGPHGESRLACLVIDEFGMVSSDLHRGPALEMTLAKAHMISARSDLRMISITTEPDVGPEVRDFLARPLVLDVVPPLEVASHARPVPVEHVLVLPANYNGSAWRELPLHTFPQDTDARTLPPSVLAVLEEMAQKSPPVSPPPDLTVHRERAASFVRNWLERHAFGRSILVACPSHDWVEAMADALIASRPAVDDGAGTVPSEDVEIPRRARVAALARAGIFEHHSEIARVLRDSVEREFRRVPRPNERTRVLIATDTLAYGVNLALDTVVIVDLIFFQGHRTLPDPTRQYLTQMRFHNLVGRAGRLGRLTSPKANVFVMARMAEPGTVGPGAGEGWFYHIVRRYYTRSQSRVSVLWKRKHDHKDAPTAVEQVLSRSVPWVRAVLDALRFAAARQPHQAASLDDVLEVFEHTLFRRMAPAQWPTAARDAREVLDGATDPALDLVTATAGGYRLTRAGEGVLDTGVHPRTLPTLRHALTIMRELWADAGGLGPIPGWLAVAAIAAQPEAMDEYLKLTPDLDPEAANGEARLDHRLFRSIVRHLEQYDVPDPRRMAIMLRDRLRMVADPGSWAVLRMWVALQAWAAGEPWDAVLRPILAHDRTPEDDPRITRKWHGVVRALSYKLRFLGYILGPDEIADGAGWFDEVAASLAHGISPQGIPFLGARGLTLDRKQVRALHRSGYPAARIMREAPTHIADILDREETARVRRHLEERWLASFRQLAGLAMGALTPEDGASARAWWRFARDVWLPDVVASRRTGTSPRRELVDESKKLATETFRDAGGAEAIEVEAWASSRTLGAPRRVSAATLGVVATLAAGGYREAASLMDGRESTLADVRRSLVACGHRPPPWLDIGCRRYFDIDAGG